MLEKTSKIKAKTMTKTKSTTANPYAKKLDIIKKYKFQKKDFNNQVGLGRNGAFGFIGGQANHYRKHAGDCCRVLHQVHIPKREEFPCDIRLFRHRLVERDTDFYLPFAEKSNSSGKVIEVH